MKRREYQTLFARSCDPIDVYLYDLPVLLVEGKPPCEWECDREPINGGGCGEQTSDERLATRVMEGIDHGRDQKRFLQKCAICMPVLPLCAEGWIHHDGVTHVFNFLDRALPERHIHLESHAIFPRGLKRFLVSVYSDDHTSTKEFSTDAQDAVAAAEIVDDPIGDITMTESEEEQFSSNGRGCRILLALDLRLLDILDAFQHDLQLAFLHVSYYTGRWPGEREEKKTTIYICRVVQEKCRSSS